MKELKFGLLCCIISVFSALHSDCSCMEELGSAPSAEEKAARPILKPEDLYSAVNGAISGSKEAFSLFHKMKPVKVSYMGRDITITAKCTKDGIGFDAVFATTDFIRSFEKTDFSHCKKSFSSSLGVNEWIDPADSIATKHIERKIPTELERIKHNLKVSFDCDGNLKCFDIVKSPGSIIVMNDELNNKRDKQGKDPSSGNGIKLKVADFGRVLSPLKGVSPDDQQNFLDTVCLYYDFKNKKITDESACHQALKNWCLAKNVTINGLNMFMNKIFNAMPNVLKRVKIS